MDPGVCRVSDRLLIGVLVMQGIFPVQEIIECAEIGDTGAAWLCLSKLDLFFVTGGGCGVVHILKVTFQIPIVCFLDVSDEFGDLFPLLQALFVFGDA